MRKSVIGAEENVVPNTAKTASSVSAPDYSGEIASSYAHNSRLYSELAASASGEAIHSFLQWDAHQPPFFRFLEQWRAKATPEVRGALEDHIREEIEEDHSGLFRTMMASLAKRFPVARPPLDQAVLSDLNYTFSPECAAREPFEFFCGTFLATEVMSAKRCAQLLEGLVRNGVPAPELSYLELHSVHDPRHGELALELFVEPLLRSGGSEPEVRRGLRDRLERSARYLRWYEANVYFR